MADATTGTNPIGTVHYDEAGNRVTLVGGTGANGQVPVKNHSTTGANTSPSMSNASATVLASNTSRKGATIFNEGAATVYVLHGATASTTTYTVQVVSGAYYEVPFGYTGNIAGITSSGTATLRVTEFT